MEPVQRIVAYVPNLMDRSRFDALNAEVKFVGLDVLETESSQADLVVIDLSRLDDLASLRHLVGVRTIGFVSHVDQERIDAAKAAGIDEVVPRSRFFGRIAQIVAKATH